MTRFARKQTNIRLILNSSFRDPDVVYVGRHLWDSGVSGGWTSCDSGPGSGDRGRRQEMLQTPG